MYSLNYFLVDFLHLQPGSYDLWFLNQLISKLNWSDLVHYYPLTRVTSLPNWTPRWLASYLLFTLPLYFLFIFYHSPQCTLQDFSSVSSLASLPFPSCRHQTTTTQWLGGGICTLEDLHLQFLSNSNEILSRWFFSFWFKIQINWIHLLPYHYNYCQHDHTFYWFWKKTQINFSACGHPKAA